LNESRVFSKASVKQLFQKYALVKLYTDTVPSQYQPTTTAQENVAVRNQWSDALPLYVILRPTESGYELLRKYDEGLINDIEAFKRFLAEPLEDLENGKIQIARK
jgi:hypothetical protein